MHQILFVSIHEMFVSPCTPFKSIFPLCNIISSPVFFSLYYGSSFLQGFPRRYVLAPALRQMIQFFSFLDQFWKYFYNI